MRLIDIVIYFVVAVIVIGIAYRLYRNKKKGENACGCGCSSCHSLTMCHSDEKK